MKKSNARGLSKALSFWVVAWGLSQVCAFSAVQCSNFKFQVDRALVTGPWLGVWCVPSAPCSWS